MTKLIGRIKLSATTELRIEVCKFQNRDMVNVRRWYITAAGKAIPTKKGAAFVVEHLPAFKNLIRDAYKHARRRGLLRGDRHVDP